MYKYLQTDIAELLRQARGLAVRSVNAVMTASYWEVGRRIVEAEQKGKRRATYGEQLIQQLAVDLTAEFGRDLSKQNLHQMCAFYLRWPAPQIVLTLSGQFGVEGASKMFATPSKGAKVLAPIRQALSAEFTLKDLVKPSHCLGRRVCAFYRWTAKMPVSSTNMKPCAAVGACVNSSAKSTVN